MIVTSLRSSSINEFKSCPMSWFCQYNLGWSGGTNMAAIKGTIVHNVLETLALLKKADQEGKKHIKLSNDILHTKDYLQTNKSLDKLTKKIYKLHTKKYDLAWTTKDEKDCITWVRKTLDSWSGEFDPRYRNIIDAEPFFDIEIIKPWSAYKYELPNGEILQGFLKLRGTIDLVTQLDNNKKNLEVIDYKSGKRKDWNTGQIKTIDDIKNDIQPRMYHYVLSKQYPDLPIMVTMLYINDGGPFSVYYNDDDIDKTENLLQNHFKQIQEATPTCHKSWKCNRFCTYGMTTFQGTSIIPICHDRMFTKCEQMEYTLKYKSVNQVLTHMSNGNLQDNLNVYNRG